MKRLIVLTFLACLGLSACGDEDKPYVKPMNKLTRVTCTLDDASTPLYTARIAYTPEGQISSIQLDDEAAQQFVWVQQVLTVIGEKERARTEYTVNGGTIVKKAVWQKNRYSPANEYASDTYTYHYKQGRLASADLLLIWPDNDGKNYRRMNYPAGEVYEWQSGNLVTYTKDKQVMAYRYEGGLKRPANFPFRPTEDFIPTAFGTFSPLNLMMGSLSQEMPTSAYTYAIPDASKRLAEYTFEYTATLNDYLTGMEIIETRQEETGTQTRHYHYSFEYNYEVTR